jgi:hypothetical protein
VSVIVTRRRVKITLVRGSRTLRVEINLVRIVITFVPVEITLCVYKLHAAGIKNTLRVKLVYKSHS